MKKLSSKVIAVIAAAAIVVGTCSYFLLKNNSQQGKVTSYASEQDFEFEEGQTQVQQESSVSKGIKIPGYSTIPVNAESTTVSVDLQNPDENDVYFQISFYLTDTEELLYQSKLLSPGQHLYSIELTRGLESGEYPLTIQYDTYSMDGSFTPKNGASVNCYLSVS